MKYKWSFNVITDKICNHADIASAKLSNGQSFLDNSVSLLAVVIKKH